jgi:hypothetical protein
MIDLTDSEMSYLLRRARQAPDDSRDHYFRRAAEIVRGAPSFPHIDMSDIRRAADLALAECKPCQ